MREQPKERRKIYQRVEVSELQLRVVTSLKKEYKIYKNFDI
jgi:hypothetical protein